jgi:RNA polymerase subunit RPABC4/transcription elongation factor Spt4
MKQCKWCGSEMENDEEWCTYCGEMKIDDEIHKE